MAISAIQATPAALATKSPNILYLRAVIALKLKPQPPPFHHLVLFFFFGFASEDHENQLSPVSLS